LRREAARHGARGLRQTAKPVTKGRRWLAKTPCNDIITARHDACSIGSRNARPPVATHARVRPRHPQRARGARCSPKIREDSCNAFTVRRTTGVQLQGPEGAQRPRALSAATSEFCGVHRRFPPSSERCPLGTTVPASGLQDQQRLPMSPEPWSRCPTPAMTAALGAANKAARNNVPDRMPVSHDRRV
jgi:hypothetical protein